jgi:hypothetical protein
MSPIDYYSFEVPPLPFEKKSRGYSVFVSNCRPRRRNQYIRAMLSYIQVDSYGRCFRNRSLGNPVRREPTERYSQKYRLLRQYKFVLTFENTQEWDYVSEKVYHGLVAGTLPVYWGAPNCNDFLPIKSVVNADDFRSPRELVFHLIKLSSNQTAYNIYMRWRNGDIGDHFLRLLLYARKTHPICSLLSRIHNLWINPYLTVWARNDSSDSGSRTLDCIQCSKSYAGPLFPQVYQGDLVPILTNIQQGG